MRSSFKLRWVLNPKRVNVCSNMVKKTSFVCACTEEEKIYREGFAQNGCYDNQPHSFEVVFYSIIPTLPARLQNKIQLSNKHTV